MIRKANREDIASVVKIYDAILDDEEAGNRRIGWVRVCIRPFGQPKKPLKKAHYLSVKTMEKLLRRRKLTGNRFRNMRIVTGNMMLRRIR